MGSRIISPSILSSPSSSSPLLCFNSKFTSSRHINATRAVPHVTIPPVFTSPPDRGAYLVTIKTDIFPQRKCIPVRPTFGWSLFRHISLISYSTRLVPPQGCTSPLGRPSYILWGPNSGPCCADITETSTSCLTWIESGSPRSGHSRSFPSTPRWFSTRH